MTKTVGTVCFIIQNNQVLLAEIEYPDGRRLWNGIGGVVENGELPEKAVVREISEETKLIVKSIDVKDVKVLFIGDLELHIFITTRYSGTLEIVDSTLKRLQWFNIDSVPYDQMHTGNDQWLPHILNTEG